MKRTIIFILIALLLFPLAAFADAKDTYNQAQELLAQSKYSEAAKLFESISTYEDASKLAMYCKACALCESGMYDLGLSAFEVLGDFKDSPMRLAYYIARGIEETSNPTDWESMETAVYKYSTNPVFLDSFERIIALKERIETLKTAEYNSAIALMAAGKYTEAISVFRKLNSYKDSNAQITTCETAILDGEYNAAVALMNAGKYSEAITAFTAIENHKDSKVHIQACKTAILDEKYEAAVALMNAGKYSEAITAFTAIKTHKDSNIQIQACETAIKTASLDGKYDAAVALMNAGKYSEAITAFTAIENHKDSKVHIQACKTAILDEKYEAAVALMNAGKYSEAITAFTAIKTHKDSNIQIQACETAILDQQYNDALELLNTKEYNHAYIAFTALTGYKDSNTKAMTALAMHLKNATVGSYVIFGHYEQDKNAQNGPEAIEWRILDKKNNRLFVISRYALDYMNYGGWSDVTWETSALRKWLNDRFLNTAFSDTEKKFIPTVTVSADKNTHKNSKTNPGNATKDQIFVLSMQESERYFTSASDRQCLPTEIIKKTIAANNGFCGWWLRNPGSNQEKAANVTCHGDTSWVGNYAYHSVGVRPALWIDLSVADSYINKRDSSTTTQTSSSTFSEASYHSLKQGDKGDDVMSMKKRLQELGYFSAGAEFSNQYNKTTTERVKLFQKANGLKQTGIADEKTLQLLFSDDAKMNPY